METSQRTVVDAKEAFTTAREQALIQAAQSGDKQAYHQIYRMSRILSLYMTSPAIIMLA